MRMPCASENVTSRMFFLLVFESGPVCVGVPLPVNRGRRLLDSRNHAHAPHQNRAIRSSCSHLVVPLFFCAPFELLHPASCTRGNGDTRRHCESAMALHSNLLRDACSGTRVRLA